MMVHWFEEYIDDPKWGQTTRVHDWRNYVSDRIKELWDTFSREQRAALIEQADEFASREEWD